MNCQKTYNYYRDPFPCIFSLDIFLFFPPGSGFWMQEGKLMRIRIYSPGSHLSFLMMLVFYYWYLIDGREDCLLVKQSQILLKVKVIVHGADRGAEAVLVLQAQPLRADRCARAPVRKCSGSTEGGKKDKEDPNPTY